MKKLISLLLAASLLLVTLVSCGVQGDTEDTEATTAAAANTTEAVPEATSVTPDIADDVNFGGHVFNVLTRGTSSATWYSRDIFSDGETGGDIIADAVFQRNSHMEAKYGFTVAEKGSNAPADDARIAVGSGDDLYDMFCFKVKDDMTSMILQGYLYDLNQVDKMNLDKPYYDQNSRKAFSIDNRLFLVTGDLLTMDNDATRCTLFNKELFNELSVGNVIGGTLYDLVSSKTWNLEAMQKCAQTVTQDLNGDGVMDLTDRYGMLSEQFNALAFTNSAGVMLYEKNADDVPFFTGNNDRALTVLFDVVTMLNGEYCRHYSNAYNEAIPQFKEGLILFYPAQLADVPLLRDMDFDFGIVPLPMYSADQDQYYSPVTTYGSNCISIPASVKDPDRAASIIEVLSCESMYVLTPAYYEINLKSRMMRDVESTISLDIILSTAVFELAYMWNLGGVYSAICTAFNDNQPSLSSAIKSTDRFSAAVIEKNIESIRKNYRF